MKKTWVVVAALAVVSVFYACSKGGDSGGDAHSGNDTFKTGMLTNFADNLIVPSYNDFQSKLGLLEVSVNTFLNTPSAANLDAVKPVFRETYLSFEKISLPFLGPSGSIGANTFLNTFPTVPAKIEAGVQSGTYNFTIAVVSDSIQGLPALDYLLFSGDAVTKFSAPNAANRKKYVQDVMARMKQLTQDILSQWNGGYRNSFIASLKTDVGSSIGLLVNRFASEMDAMKGPRIGWPFGKQSNGIVFADKCEGYYAGISAALLVANLTSLKNYYMGGAGAGIDDYLVLLKRDQLNNDVLTQFEVALTALKAIPEPMSAAFTQHAPVIEEAYRQVQKLLTLLKTDVASATSVQINYMDSDGD